MRDRMYVRRLDLHSPPVSHICPTSGPWLPQFPQLPQGLVWSGVVNSQQQPLSSALNQVGSLYNSEIPVPLPAPLFLDFSPYTNFPAASPVRIAHAAKCRRRAPALPESPEVSILRKLIHQD